MKVETVRKHYDDAKISYDKLVALDGYEDRLLSWAAVISSIEAARAELNNSRINNDDQMFIRAGLMSLIDKLADEAKAALIG